MPSRFGFGRIGHPLCRTRARSNFIPARPNICRLIPFNRPTWPSTWPLLHPSVSAACTAAASDRRLAARFTRSRSPNATAFASQSASVVADFLRIIAIRSSAVSNTAWTAGFRSRSATNTRAECPSGFGLATRNDSFRADGGVRSAGVTGAFASRRPGRPRLPISRFKYRRAASYPPVNPFAFNSRYRSALLRFPADFLRVLDAGGVSAIRLDPLRLGGITPARKVAAAAELRHIAIYPVRLPEIGTQLGAATVYGRLCEYVDWFADLFSGGPKFQNNQLLASSDPGLGLTVNDDYAAKCRV